jgi:hypothetical protein
MDEGVQAAQGTDQGSDEGLVGRTAQPREVAKGKPGRRKSIRPIAPELTRELVVTIRHFLPELAVWLGGVKDKRDPKLVTFPLKVLLLQGVLMFLTHSGSRNHFNNWAPDAVQMARLLGRLMDCEVEAVAHLDTLEGVLRKLDPVMLELVLSASIRRLIRMKALDGWRVGGRFLLAIDGTGMHSFSEPHCEECLKTEHADGTVTYSHKLLVAFLVSQDGFALPVACEFIENAGGIYVKQDCEKKAFHRLERRLRTLFPQTPFWLLLDALYADQNVMRPCFGHGWNFCISFLDTDMPALWKEAQALLALSPGQRASMTLPNKEGSREVRWINDLDYAGMSLGVIFQTDRDDQGQIVAQFAHLTARLVHRDNVWSVASAARLRWRCENEGFNVLKNGGFALEHVYSRNPTAAKCYCHIMLLAHLLQQLLIRGRLGAVFEAVFKSFRHYGQKLAQSLASSILPQDLPMPGQIRLSTA